MIHFLNSAINCVSVDQYRREDICFDNFVAIESIFMQKGLHIGCVLCS
jgi:hypothetical protein